MAAVSREIAVSRDEADDIRDFRRPRRPDVHELVSDGRTTSPRSNAEIVQSAADGDRRDPRLRAAAAQRQPGANEEHRQRQELAHRRAGEEET